MSNTVTLIELEDFIRRINVGYDMTPVKVKIETDNIKLTCFDKHNRFIICWEEDTDSEKTNEVKRILEYHKIILLNGEYTEEDVKKIK